MSEPRRFDLAGHFISEMGFTHQVEEGLARGWGWHAPELSVPGTVFPHASVMLTFADILLGLLSGFACAPRISLTVDLRAQVIYAPPFGPIEIDGHLLKTGRTTTVGETTFSEPGADLPFAISFGTFIGSPRPVDVRDSDPARTDELPKMLSLTQPFTERLGIRIVEPGVADADHRPDLLNSSDSIQGGVLALIAEVAAQSLATAEGGRTFVVDDLDIRYLRAAQWVRRGRRHDFSISPTPVRPSRSRSAIWGPTTASSRTQARSAETLSLVLANDSDQPTLTRPVRRWRSHKIRTKRRSCDPDPFGTAPGPCTRVAPALGANRR